MKTNILKITLKDIKIKDNEVADQIKKNEITKNELSELIFNLDNSNYIKLLAINSFYNYYGEEIIEIINKVTCMYLISGILKLEELLNIVVLGSNINETLKLECAKCLITKNKCKKNYKLLYDILHLNHEDIPITCQIESIKLLILSPDFINESLELLTTIINNLNIECEYRYKLILSFEHFENDIKKDMKEEQDENEYNDGVYNIITPYKLKKIIFYQKFSFFLYFK